MVVRITFSMQEKLTDMLVGFSIRILFCTLTVTVLFFFFVFFLVFDQ